MDIDVEVKNFLNCECDDPSLRASGLFGAFPTFAGQEGGFTPRSSSRHFKAEKHIAFTDTESLKY